MRGAVQVAITLLCLAAETATLLGLLVRRRLSICWSFPIYLVAVLVPSALFLAWPERFYHLDFWLAKESLHALLKFCIAVEITLKAFRAFPSALATVRRVVLFVLTTTYVVILAVPVNRAAGDADLNITLTTQVLPRIHNGTVWLFTGIAGVILWYRLPVNALHKAILVGFVPYLLVFTVGLNILSSNWSSPLNHAYTSAYFLLLTYWAYVAWKPALAPLQAPPGASSLGSERPADSTVQRA